MKSITLLLFVFLSLNVFSNDIHHSNERIAMVQKKQSVSPVYKKPFSELLALEKEKGGWMTNTSEKARAFHKERMRLGKNFVSELLIFIANDVDRHYAIGYYLSEPSYLGKYKPMYELALLIFLQGIPLTKKSSNFLIQCQEVSFRVSAVMVAHKLGYKTLAVYHKTIAQHLMKNSLYSGGFPAMSETELKIYKSIKTERGYLKK